LKTYWDTSAVINAFLSLEVFARLNIGEHCTRLHTLAEFFSTMTGRGVPVMDNGRISRAKMSPNDCASWLREFADKVQFEELSRNDILDALDKAQARNVQGGHIYDYLHALTSKKAKSDGLLTRNSADFKGLADNLSWP
jgi:hypothetical protein